MRGQELNIDRLRLYADHRENMPEAKPKKALRDADDVVEMLRVPSGMKDEILLDNTPPKGNA